MLDYTTTAVTIYQMAFAVGEGGRKEEAYTTLPPIPADVPADKGQTNPNQNDKAKNAKSGYVPGTLQNSFRCWPPVTSHLPSPTGSLGKV